MPELFQPLTHQVALPVIVVVGCTLQVVDVQVMPALPTWYHFWIGLPVESFTHNWYQVAPLRALQLYTGALPAPAPDGVNKVGVPTTPLLTVKFKPSLQGPVPLLFHV